MRSSIPKVTLRKELSLKARKRNKYFAIWPKISHVTSNTGSRNVTRYIIVCAHYYESSKTKMFNFVYIMYIRFCWTQISNVGTYLLIQHARALFPLISSSIHISQLHAFAWNTFKNGIATHKSCLGKNWIDVSHVRSTKGAQNCGGKISNEISTVYTCRLSKSNSHTNTYRGICTAWPNATICI